MYLTVLEDNIPAIKQYEKSGFVYEGIHREAVYENGIYLNMKIISILKSEFRSANRKFCRYVIGLYFLVLMVKIS